MDSFQMNKILGAILGTVFVLFSVGIIADSVFSTHAPEQPGFAIAAAESDTGGESEAPSGPEPIGPLLANADPAKGEASFRKCVACHTVENGGANKVGPNLWDIVDRPVASHEGFSYSAAMREYAQGGEVTWDYERLSHFLMSPRREVPGTAMGFAGLPRIEERADVIAYLRTLSDDPKPLPAAEEAPAEEPAAEEAPAEEPAAEEAPAEEPAAEEAPAEEAPAEEPAAEEPAAEEEERPANE